MLENNFAIAELQRKVANIIRIGVVKEVDCEKAKVRVKIGDIVTDYLPWITSKAGKDRDWSGTFKKVCQAAFLVQLNFQSIWKENIKLRHS